MLHDGDMNLCAVHFRVLYYKIHTAQGKHAVFHHRPEFSIDETSLFTCESQISLSVLSEPTAKVVLLSGETATLV